jgi:hypothetical protein
MKKKLKFGEINTDEIMKIAISVIAVVTVYQIAKAIVSFFKDPVAKGLGWLSEIDNWLDNWLGTCGNCKVMQTDQDTGITTLVDPPSSSTSCNKYFKPSCVLKLFVIPALCILIVFATLSRLFGWGKSPLSKLWESMSGRSYKDICKEVRENIRKTLSDKDAMEKLKESTAQANAKKTDDEWKAMSEADKDVFRNKVTREFLENQVITYEIDSYNKKIGNTLTPEQQKQLSAEAIKTFINADIAYSNSESSKNEKDREKAIDRVSEARGEPRPE